MRRDKLASTLLMLAISLCAAVLTWLILSTFATVIWPIGAMSLQPTVISSALVLGVLTGVRTVYGARLRSRQPRP